MEKLKVIEMGDAVQGIRLLGDRRRPEPEHVRIMFPGGDVDLVRTTEGKYWVHVRLDSQADVEIGAADAAGRVADARVDIRGRHASECSAGDLGHPELYHLAVLVERAP